MSSLNRPVNISRDKNGIPHIKAESIPDACYGQGYVHAKDRGLQLVLMRILGQGRASELLDSSDEMLGVDTFFRKMNWSGSMTRPAADLSAFGRECLEAYAAGVNDGLNGRYPWEFRLLGVQYEPWTIQESILISRMVGYLTLAQSQGEVERFIVEMIQAGVAPELLNELFEHNLEGLDIELVKSVKLQHQTIPKHLLWELGAPRFMASNNWVLAGSKTASGHPMVCNDPHLEVNRIPNVWHEIVMQVGENYLMGGCMPGAPGVLSGRNRELAWGVTYAFMDSEDSWIEKCKDGQYYREDSGWQSFAKRIEVIKRKKKADATVIFYENHHGVLDGDPYAEGSYLATRWACDNSGGRTLSQILEMWRVTTVAGGMETLGQVETAWNFVFGDRQGNIGYQMSGLMPLRAGSSSGLIPLPGWIPANDWQGFAKVDELPRALNPDQGFFVTTNNDLNQWGIRRPLNMPMGPYRAERVEQVLASRENFTKEDMFKLHYDVYSTQAEQFMQILIPLLPKTPQAEILRQWDYTYTPESKGAWLFEEVYHALYRAVFGGKGIGTQIIDYLQNETGMFIDFYINFDTILLKSDSSWFGGENRDDLFRGVLAAALDVQPRCWGSGQKVRLSHILFGKTMPAFLGFDRGPITIIGGRATPHQGQIYRSANRLTTFVPSFRIISELETDSSHTNLAGGAVDRRFSRYYCNDLDNWVHGNYKELRPDNASGKFP
ncbi:MAG: penicillin acylase family protein [Leptospiraceae bacterium]|nr:penicillin acylase family protein [Leptospiraceae bacterium]